MDGEYPRLDRERLSTLTALILLTYGLIRVVSLPSPSADLAFLGLVIRFELNTRIIMLTLASALAVAGVDWLMESHPAAETQRRAVEHWIIPALAAFGIGDLLSRLPAGPALWIGLILAAGLLIATMVAEFLVVDARDPRRDVAAIGLRALVYLLLVQSVFAVRAAGLRAFFAVPAIFLASTAVTWRLLKLSRVGGRVRLYALLAGGITSQLAWGLHYLPLEPLAFSLLTGLAAYVASGLLLSHLEDGIGFFRAVEYGLLSVLALIAILSLT